MRLHRLALVCATLGGGAVACTSLLGDFDVGGEVDAGAVFDASGGIDAADSGPTFDASGDAADAAPGCRADQLECDGACVENAPAHCGSCTAACAPAEVCQVPTDGGAPGCASTCPATQPTTCNGTCVDTKSNPGYCGGCNTACIAPVGAQPTCADGGCDFTCLKGFHRCGARCADDTSVSSCGTSCTACTAPPNGTPTCNGTSCAFTCSGGLVACGTQCVNTATDPGHCGSCTKVCSAAAQCTSSACVVRYGLVAPLSSNTASSPNYFAAQRIDVPQAVTVTNLGAYIKTTPSAAYSIALGLYANNAGHPGNRVTQGTAVVSAAGPVEIAVPAVAIAAGTYFVGATQSAYAAYGYDEAVNSNYEFYNNNPNTLWTGAAPNPAPATSTLTPGRMNVWIVAKE